MKLSTLIFALLFLVVQTSHAQTTRSASMEGPKAAKGMSDAEILAKASQIKYLALYQDYSNIASAMAGSSLKVADRLPTLKRLSETYFFKQPKTVALPTNLLKPDGSTMSDQEMSDLVGRLTQSTSAGTASKSTTQTAQWTSCFQQFYSTVYTVNPDAVIVDGWIILLPQLAQNIPSCASVPAFSAAPVSSVVSGN